jgi:hypothetical protein
LNTRKTKTVIFCRKNIVHETFCFYYGHRIIELVTEYKYLGILFKNTGILKCASENLTDRACKAYYSLKSKIPESDKFSVKTWLKLYKSMVLPILMDQKFG